MTRRLIIERAGLQTSVQDLGRPGHIGLGLSRGGAADRSGFLDGLALTHNPLSTAAIEMAGMGGTFRFSEPTRIALSGAEMRVTLDGALLEWNASHDIKAGEKLNFGAATEGIYAYLHVEGGIETEIELGGRARHGIAGLGRALEDGDSLRIGQAQDATPPERLPKSIVQSGPIRVIQGPQTALFDKDTLARFQATDFIRSATGNRQGVRMDFEGAPFASGDQLSQVSDFIAEGDIQMTGDGAPYVLMADCQTMGGYPRIGSVIPFDLPRIAQAQPGHHIRFQIISLEEADKLWQSDADALADRLKRLQPRTRDPREMTDLLSYELVDKPPPEIAG